MISCAPPYRENIDETYLVVICSAAARSLSCLGAKHRPREAPQSEIDAHVAAARTAAGRSSATRSSICACPARRAAALPAAGRRPGRGGRAGRAGCRRRGAAARGGGAPQTPDRANWYAPPFKVFDNLSGWARASIPPGRCRRAPGLIIIDTNFAWATEPEIIDGLTKLGLNPRDIKYVIISHAHGDHDQGAAELQKRFGAKVVMGAADWDSTLQRPATAAGGVPTRDIAVGPEGRS